MIHPSVKANADFNLSKSDLERMKSFFAGYVTETARQASNDAHVLRNLNLKKEHTYNVCSEISSLAEELELSTGQQYFAEISALFHDIGRFEQFIRYGTFHDQDSENHATLGVRILKQTGILKKSGLDSEQIKLLLRLIEYHNRIEVPPEETHDCKFFSALLRDADKLDIFRVVIDHYQTPVEEQNASVNLGFKQSDKVSSQVCSAVLHKQPVRIQDVETLADFKMLQSSWIFDINFSGTCRRIDERSYLLSIRDSMELNQQSEKMFSLLISYAQNNCAERS
ncbi:MAG: HD domain-containing protein [Spirochaetales bacterium]|nr:HD domain-containing protein [Spirochaetales bacterium]